MNTPRPASLSASATAPALDDSPSIFVPKVAELVAIGASIASHCEPCLEHHVGEARRLGISSADIDRAVALAARVKDAPHQHILKLAQSLTQSPPEPDHSRTVPCRSGQG